MRSPLFWDYYGKEVREKYMQGLEDVDRRELAIHRRVSRLNYSRRCAEASAVQAYQKRGLPLAPGMEIGYLVRDAPDV
jgi:DNA polymerase, archaea type